MSAPRESSRPRRDKNAGGGGGAAAWPLSAALVLAPSELARRSCWQLGGAGAAAAGAALHPLAAWTR